MEYDPPVAGLPFIIGSDVLKRWLEIEAQLALNAGYTLACCVVHCISLNVKNEQSHH